MTSKGTRVLLLAGTKKGVFMGRSDRQRRAWRFSGPYCSGTWAFYDIRFDAATDTIFAGGASNWYGAAVWRSHDLGETWSHSDKGLTFGDGGPVVEQVWCVRPAGEALYAGVDPAGLFQSADGGQTWQELTALRAHPSSRGWSATNGGTPLHTILPQAHDGQRMWVAISAGGVYRTDDGGASWCQQGEQLHPCVHALEASVPGSRPGGEPRIRPDESVPALYQRSHDGVWRSDDGGTTWRDISSGLPSRFGFSLAVHPHDEGVVYVVPLAGVTAGQRYVPEGRVAVWRSRNGGEAWERLTAGLPEGQAYLSVLRRGLAVDAMDPCGVFFGTPTGQVFGSADEGDSWFEVTRGLPPVYALSCAVVEEA